MENCKQCGSPLLTLHNDSDREYWFECEDCGETFEATKEDWTLKE